VMVMVMVMVMVVVVGRCLDHWVYRCSRIFVVFVFVFGEWYGSAGIPLGRHRYDRDVVLVS